MKVVFVAYLSFCVAAFVVQIVTSDFFLICQYNGGACTYMVLEQTWNALTWPRYLLPA